MARTGTKKKPKMFYATMHIIRVEQWCVEAETKRRARYWRRAAAIGVMSANVCTLTCMHSRRARYLPEGP